jgi:hypothetical protein
MKKIIILYLLLFAFGSIFAQKQSIAPKQKKNFALPKSLFNLDFNYSRSLNEIDENFGIISIKAMIGSNNTGIIIGVKPLGINYGDLEENPNLEIQLGYQKRIFKGLFTSLSIELTRVKYTYYDTSDYNLSLLEKIKILPSLITSIGYTISLGKTKRFYLNYEVNYYLIDGFRDYYQDNFGYEFDKRLNLIGGLGYRFGSPAKTSYDGIKNITTVPLKP